MMGVAENIADLRSLLSIVAEDTGALKMDDADDESVGWTTEGPLPMTFGHVRRAHAALAALEAALSTDAEPVKTAPAVAVKALEWNPYRAETPFGYYHIDDQRDRSLDELEGRPPFLLSGSRLNLSRHSTLQEAKAAAQADYEARILSALSAQVQDVASIPPSIDTMRNAAKDLILKNGWQPNHRLSLHSVAGLMAEFGMQVYRGEVGCGYPDCGCCADAACEDAIKRHPDFASPTSKHGGS